jgi:hypothetical protein
MQELVELFIKEKNQLKGVSPKTITLAIGRRLRNTQRKSPLLPSGFFCRMALPLAPPSQ